MSKLTLGQCLFEEIEQLKKENEELKQINEEHRKLNGELRNCIDKAIKFIENNTMYFDKEYASIYGELCDCEGYNANRIHCVIGDKEILEILKESESE